MEGSQNLLFTLTWMKFRCYWLSATNTLQCAHLSIANSYPEWREYVTLRRSKALWKYEFCSHNTPDFLKFWQFNVARYGEEDRAEYFEDSASTRKLYRTKYRNIYYYTIFFMKSVFSTGKTEKMRLKMQYNTYITFWQVIFFSPPV